MKITLDRMLLPLLVLLFSGLLHPNQAHAQGYPVFDMANFRNTLQTSLSDAENYLEQVRIYETQLQQYEDMVLQAEHGQFQGVLMDYGTIGRVMGDVALAYSDVDSGKMLVANAKLSTNLHASLTNSFDALGKAMQDAKTAGGRDAMINAQNALMSANAQIQEIVAQQAVAQADQQNAILQRMANIQNQAAQSLLTTQMPVLNGQNNNSQRICGSGEQNPYCAGISTH